MLMRIAAAVVFLSGVVSECSAAEVSPAPSDARTADEVTRAAAVRPRALARVTSGIVCGLEVKHPPKPASLSLVEAAVQGTVTGFEPGPARGRPSALVRVAVERVAKGDLAVGSAVGVVLVGASRSAVGRAMPAGSAVVLYLSNDLPKRCGDVWGPVTTQGFIVGESDGVGVVLPLAHERRRGQSLNDQLPRTS